MSAKTKRTIIGIGLMTLSMCLLLLTKLYTIVIAHPLSEVITGAGVFLATAIVMAMGGYLFITANKYE